MFHQYAELDYIMRILLYPLVLVLNIDDAISNEMYLIVKALKQGNTQYLVK